ncbi:MAG: CYTH domain-containing protein [archaeon]
MVYEIEKRARVTPQEIGRCMKFLEEQGQYFGEKEMKTFLFMNPIYLRVRLIKNQDEVLVTNKQGGYEDKARKETQIDLPYKQLKPFIQLMQLLGFKECASWNTQREFYRLNGLNVEMSKSEHLGNILEVEALTTQQIDIGKLEKKVRDTLRILKLKEIDAKEYQKMMDELYKKTLKPISQHSFTI